MDSDDEGVADHMLETRWSQADGDDDDADLLSQLISSQTANDSSQVLSHQHSKF